MRTIAVFGCGYVGLVTAACLARLGHSVRAYDTDITKLSALQLGTVPFYEPGLQPLVASELSRQHLTFADSAHAALDGAQLAFIAVGTPTGPTGEADLTYVRQAAREIAACASGPLIVVNKSTVPVETADMVERIINASGCAHPVIVASNPEFLREGCAVGDFMHPDRIVIGASHEQAIATLQEVYEPLGAPIHVVDVHTAEMIKYCANAFLAMKISFINEIANLCGAVEADIDGVIAGIGADARIGNAYLMPGLGFGGSCLPKDVAALANVARAHAIEPTMLEATLSVNRRQIVVGLGVIEGAVGEVCDRHFAVAGVAFKGGTDDIRSSPAIVLIEALRTRGAEVTAYDPIALPRARSVLRDGVRFAYDLPDACAGADALIVASDDRSFLDVDWHAVARALRGRHVIDLRNRLNPTAIRQAGLQYSALGRARGQAVAS